jgi:hypothetical protein
MNKSELNQFLGQFEADDIELAQQLLKLRQEPPLELKRTILAIPQWKGQSLFTSRFSWGIALVLVMLFLFISPVAKATLGQVQRLIGQIQLTVSDILPGSERQVTGLSRPVSLEEARAIAPFEVVVPAYLPASLAANEPELSIIELENPIVKILWRDGAGGFVQLTTHHPHKGQAGHMETLVGPDSSEAILINGQQAVLIQGGWDEESQMWSHRQRLKTLIWEVDRVQYKLLYFGTTIPISELIAMAESIQ